jgi:triacylglycerol lipase
MKRVVSEIVKTLTLTTIHPVGWGVQRVQRKIRSKLSQRGVPSPADLVHQHNSPILLVHGIFHNSTAFWKMERSLEGRGFKRLRSLELWTSLESFDDLVASLKKEIFSLSEAQRARGEPRRVRIVAHSLGGVVVRASLRDPEISRIVEKIIFLGTPHQGNFFFQHMPFPSCLRELKPEGPLLKTLKESPLPSGISYWNFRAGMDAVAFRKDTFLPHVHNLIFPGVGHAGLLVDNHVLAAVATCLEEG